MSHFTRLMLPFENGDVLVPEDGTIVALRAQPNAYGSFTAPTPLCYQTFAPLAAQLSAQGLQTVSEIPHCADVVILHITRSKEENKALLSKAFDILPIGGRLVVDGAKTDGIDSLLKAVKKHLPVDGQDAKSHGKVFWLTKQQASNPVTDWANALTPTKNKDGFFTNAGMFSVDGIDAGSAELAQAVEGKLTGFGADLGAGWGWLSHQVLQTNPKITALDLIEAESTALHCAQRNITDARANFSWSDVLQQDAKRKYDFIVMNPPFHVGRKPDPALGRSFISMASKLLKPSGHLYLVANRQLAYEATLTQDFNRFDLLNQSSTFKLIHARKPK